MPGGRPSKLTPERAQRIYDTIGRGVGREKAARLAGIDPSTFHRWMADGGRFKSGKYHEFRKGVLRVEAELQNRLVEIVEEIALNDKNSGIRLGAARFLLERRFPEDFAQRREVRTTGGDGGPVKVEAKVSRPLFTDEQLEAMTPEQLEAAIGAASGVHV